MSAGAIIATVMASALLYAGIVLTRSDLRKANERVRRLEAAVNELNPGLRILEDK